MSPPNHLHLDPFPFLPSHPPKSPLSLISSYPQLPPLFDCCLRRVEKALTSILPVTVWPIIILSLSLLSWPSSSIIAIDDIIAIIFLAIILATFIDVLVAFIVDIISVVILVVALPFLSSSLLPSMMTSKSSWLVSLSSTFYLSLNLGPIQNHFCHPLSPSLLMTSSPL